MKRNLNQHIKNIERQEQKLFNKPANPLFQSTIGPASQKLQDKIPEKLKVGLNTAFYKGFQLVFEKGSSIIEKTYDKSKISSDYDMYDYAVGKEFSKRHMRMLDKQSKQSKLMNSSFSAIEGGVLGVLGIGIPDIPLFISVMLKTIYEIALSYGFQYDNDDEKAYILILISAAVSKGTKQMEFDDELEQLSSKIDRDIVTNVNTELQMKTTSEMLSDSLLTAKFIQGIPIIGAVGGAVNYTVLNKIGNYARIKYKKRYLLKKVIEERTDNSK